MTLGSVYFCLCAVVCVAGALVTIAAKNPIRGALGLLGTIVGIAGLYLRLNAQFLAAVQLIVYAGAIVVLFVFVLMLLGADATDSDISYRSAFARISGGVGIGLAILGLVGRALKVYAPPEGRFPPLEQEYGTVKQVGAYLFSSALIPFELSTALLIVAAIGAIAIARSNRARPVAGAKQVTDARRFFGGPILDKVSPRASKETLP
jgi:NADH-quinone oxidoreductase subunit J